VIVGANVRRDSLLSNSSGVTCARAGQPRHVAIGIRVGVGSLDSCRRCRPGTGPTAFGSAMSWDRTFEMACAV
jgi:hypothetical protein